MIAGSTLVTSATMAEGVRYALVAAVCIACGGHVRSVT